MVVLENTIYVAQIGLITICLFGLVLMALRGIFIRSTRQYWQYQREEAPFVLLFEKGVLVDANRDATALLGTEELKDVTWAHVRGVLANRIGSIPVALGQSEDPIRTHPSNARAGELRATLEQWNNFARLSVYNWPTQNRRKGGVRVPVAEFESLTNAAMDSPFPIWRTCKRNKLIWANPAFFKECGNRIRLGESAEHLKIDIPADLKSGASFRAEYDSFSQGIVRYFDVTMIVQGDTRTYFAVNADKAVQADDARKNFIQTLAKTFAQLSTGLAIFKTSA